MKKIIRILSLSLVLCMLTLTAVPTYAANKVKIIPETLWAGADIYTCIWFDNMPDDAKLVKIKSSNKKIIKAVKYGSGIYDHYIRPRKKGTATITVTYEYNNETKTISAKYRVKKYPKPIKYLIVNGKKVNIKKHRYSYDIHKYKKTKAKIKIKLAKGWKILSVQGLKEKVKDESRTKDFTPKNNKSFKIPKGYNCYIYYHIENKKHETMTYSVSFMRTR